MYKKNLYLIQFYANEDAWGCWTDIYLAWVYAADEQTATAKLKKLGIPFVVIIVYQYPEIISLSNDFKISPPDTNIFIIN